ncbi:MAG: hypothetical protein V7L23_15315 [Nostoc sp.]|uniref:hypothetical protein n=1 Tax=Nostoc sp. TaxID=1180 RepID=UPI002FF1C732
MTSLQAFYNNPEALSKIEINLREILELHAELIENTLTLMDEAAELQKDLFLNLVREAKA